MSTKCILFMLQYVWPWNRVVVCCEVLQCQCFYKTVSIGDTVHGFKDAIVLAMYGMNGIGAMVAGTVVVPVHDHLPILGRSSFHVSVGCNNQTLFRA